jgi:hypothetical protein
VWEVKSMTEEYILLFNTITDTLETLDALRAKLIAAQRKPKNSTYRDNETIRAPRLLEL